MMTEDFSVLEKNHTCKRHENCNYIAILTALLWHYVSLPDNIYKHSRRYRKGCLRNSSDAIYVPWLTFLMFHQIPAEVYDF